MKKITGVAVAVLAAAALTGCASTQKAAEPVKTGPLNTSTKIGMEAISAEAMAEAAGLSSAEAKATTNFANAVIEPWSLNQNKNYIQDTAADMFINVQYEGTDWDKDITKTKAELIDTGDGDKALALNLGLNKDSHMYGILFNISEQGAHQKDISHSIFKLNVYIPEELVLDNAEEFVPTLKFAIRNSGWAQMFLGGDLKSFTFKDIGAGWHTITLNFETKTFDLGSKTGTFTADSTTMKACNMIDLYIQGKRIASNLDVPVLVDWISLTEIPEK